MLLRGCNAYIRHLTISHNTALPCLTPQKHAEPWFVLSPALGHYSLPKINWGQYLWFFFLGGGGGGGGQTGCIVGDVQMENLQAFSNTPLRSSKKWGQVLNLSHGNEFYLHKNENHFDIKGWALNLVLMQRPRKTRKWPTGARNFGRHVSVHQYV